MTVGEEGGIVAFFAAFSLVFSFGCRSSAYEEYAFGEPVVLREDMKVSSEDFNAARVAFVDSRKELEVARIRSEWLAGEQQLAWARLSAAQARDIENGLAVQIARFKALEAKVPGGEVSSVRESLTRWEGKLQEYAAETARRDAKVRLLIRDVNPLRRKAKDAGIDRFSSDANHNDEGEP